MIMLLYIRTDLLKSDRGGKYHAKIQIGTHPDGRPKFKYFYDQESYEKYKNKQGHGLHAAETDKDLAREVKEEHEEGKRYVQDHVKNKAPTQAENKDDEEPRTKQDLLFLKT